MHEYLLYELKFCFTFPAPDEVLTRKGFKTIAKTDCSYAYLLNTEYQYCKSHLNDIIKKANNTYKIGCNKNHFLNHTCCDFKKLETEYLNYDNAKTYASI